MIEIGKYRICFTSRYWIQTYAPTKSRKFLFVTVYWAARSTDIDKKQCFEIGTPMLEDGRKYRYYRAASDIQEGRLVGPAGEQD